MKRKQSKRVAPVKPAGIVPADTARCCTCGKPLLRLPPSLASESQTRVFQCADCFYPGIGRTAQGAAPVASAGNRWLRELSLDSSD